MGRNHRKYMQRQKKWDANKEDTVGISEYIRNMQGRDSGGRWKGNNSSCDFVVESTDIKACSIAPQGMVDISYALWSRFVMLAGIRDKEWLAYLVGTIVEGNATIEGCYFPPQSVSGAHVHSVSECDSYAVLPRTVGAIHSHVRMTARFSKQDLDAANWPLELVINASGEYEASLRTKLVCGGWMRVPATVRLSNPDTSDDADLQAAIDVGEEFEARSRTSIRFPEQLTDIPPQMHLNPSDVLSREDWENMGGYLMKKK